MTLAKLETMVSNYAEQCAEEFEIKLNDSMAPKNKKDDTLVTKELLETSLSDRIDQCFKGFQNKLDDFKKKMAKLINETEQILQDRLEKIEGDMASVKERLKSCETQKNNAKKLEKLEMQISNIQEQHYWTELKDASRYLLFRGVKWEADEKPNDTKRKIMDILKKIKCEVIPVQAFRLRKVGDQPPQIKVEMDSIDSRKMVTSCLKNMARVPSLRKIHVARNVPLFQRKESVLLERRLYELRQHKIKARVVPQGLKLILQVQDETGHYQEESN